MSLASTSHVETARGEVLRAAQDLKGAFVARGEDPRAYALQVENALGELVFSLPFSEIFDAQAEAAASPPKAVRRVL